MNAGRGADVVYGRLGNDRLSGQRGNDELHGGESTCCNYPGPYDDVLLGGRGNDVLFGGTGSDYMEGNPGVDRIHGGRGDESVALTGDGDSVFGASLVALRHCLVPESRWTYGWGPGE